MMNHHSEFYKALLLACHNARFQAPLVMIGSPEQRLTVLSVINTVARETVVLPECLTLSQLVEQTYRHDTTPIKHNTAHHTPHHLLRQHVTIVWRGRAPLGFKADTYRDYGF